MPPKKSSMDHVKSVSAMAEYFDVELSNIQAEHKKDIDKWVITFDHNGTPQNATDTNVR
jgi:hypothetical protein